MIVGMVLTSRKPNFSVGGVFLLYFWNGLHTQTLKFFLIIELILGKRWIFHLLPFSHQYACISTCRSVWEWARICAGVCSNIDRRMTKTNISTSTVVLQFTHWLHNMTTKASALSVGAIAVSQMWKWLNSPITAAVVLAHVMYMNCVGSYLFPHPLFL